MIRFLVPVRSVEMAAMAIFCRRYNKSNKDLIPVLRELGILKPREYFVCCGHEMTQPNFMQENALLMVCYFCNKKTAVTTGSILHDTKISWFNVLAILRCWALDRSQVAASDDTFVSERSVAEVYRTCRAVASRWLMKYHIKMGGPGDIVEIDEVHLGRKKKYGRGTYTTNVDEWVVSIYERRRKIVAFRMLPNQKRETIFPIIEEYVQKGSIIVTDEASVYGTPGNKPLHGLGYFHETVNHSAGEYVRYVDGWTDSIQGRGWYTNSCEGMHNQLRLFFRTHGNPNQNIISEYLDEYMFRNMVMKRALRYQAFDVLCGAIGDAY